MKEQESKDKRSRSLSVLQDLRTVLGQLDAEHPAALRQYMGRQYTGRTLYAQREGDFLKRLDLEIASRRGKARILVTGQIGVGKSSELLYYFRTKRMQGGNDFWIFCDLDREEHPERCGATGVFLAIFRDCWSSISRYYPVDQQYDLPGIRNEVFDRLVDWLKGERDESKVVFQFGGMSFPVFLNDKDGALSLVLGKAAQHEAVSQPSERFGLAPDSLINLLNKVLDWVTRERRNVAPVLFVDHTDKIRDPLAAEEVLVKVAPQWGRIRASIVVTAPFENTLGDLRYSVESKWGRPLILYPVEIPNLNSGPIPSIYGQIVKDAQLRPLIRDDSVRLLAHYSGGILRTFVRFLLDACKETHLNRHDQIEPSDANTVIHSAEQAYQDYSTEGLDLLDQIEQKGTGLGKAASLLRSPIGLLITEPQSGEQRLKVHPLARAALQRYHLKQDKG